MAPGRIERLSAEDAAILGLETDAIKGHICDVVVLDAAADGSPLDLEALRAEVAARLAAEPRCRQRLEPTPLGLAPPAWIDDADFAIERHVDAVDGERAADDERLREIVAALFAERLDHSRPLWRIDVLGMSGGRAALVGRFHHAMCDGMGALRVLRSLVWSDSPDFRAPAPPPWEAEPAPSGTDLVVSGLAGRAGGLAGELGGALRTLADPGRLRSSAGELLAIPGAVLRELRPGASAGTPFDRAIGPRREVALAEASLDEVRAIAAAQSGERHVTVNDVVVAAVAAGIRAWLGPQAGAEAMRVKIPVSMHRRSERADEIGNRDSFMFVDLPVGEADPIAALRIVNAETTERKEHHDPEELYTFFHGLSHLSPLHRRAVELSRSPRTFTLAVSNVPGPREPSWVQGRRVRALYPFAEPAARHALRLSIRSLERRLFFGLTTDPDALSGIDAIAAGIQTSLAEMAERSR
jgi:WS/DGAT/MGAT family acyltransferase